MIVSLYQTLGNTLYTVRADYDCVWGLFSTVPSIESNNPKCCLALPEAWVPAYAGGTLVQCTIEQHANTSFGTILLLLLL